MTLESVTDSLLVAHITWMYMYDNRYGSQACAQLDGKQSGSGSDGEVHRSYDQLLMVQRHRSTWMRFTWMRSTWPACEQFEHQCEQIINWSAANKLQQGLQDHLPGQTHIAHG